MANEINIEYKIEEFDKLYKEIRIFGSDFVVNNENICEIIYKGEKYKLNENFNVENNENDDILKIKLININKITNISHIFEQCSSLLSVSDISKIDISNITDISFMFSECRLLPNLPDISFWDTRNIISMRSFFKDCILLKSLPDISKWDIQNVNDMNAIFSGCISLLSLPDISKWNTSKVVNMGHIFQILLITNIVTRYF